MHCHPRYWQKKYYYDTLNRLTSVDINGTTNAQQFGYDVLGNIRSKTGVAGLEYNDTRPHAVSKANGVDYMYNGNGALTTGGGRNVIWTSFNKPAFIYNSAATSIFSYGPSRARYKHQSLDAVDTTKNQTTYYVGGSFEKVVTNGVTKYKHYIKAGGQSVAQYTIDSNQVEKTEYLLRDNQGSTVAVTDELGNVTAQLDYDAFGRRRAVLGDTGISSIIASIPRGYTGHEHLDKLGLIHMNGRVYDPELGRFLSADPFIQFSKNIQSYNRFSYVLNNPMSYTDPSGFFSFRKAIRKIAKVAAAVITVGPSAAFNAGVAYSKPVRRFFLKYQWARIGLQASSYFCGPGQALCAAASSAYLTDISGGSFGDVAKAAVVSYYTVKTFNYVHGEFNGGGWDIAKKILAHGAIGGTSSFASGGSFKDGFIGAAVSQGAFKGLEATGFEFFCGSFRVADSG